MNQSGRSIYTFDESTRSTTDGGIGVPNSVISSTAAEQPPVEVYTMKKPKSGCKQVYDKSNFCIFCEKEIRSKIARHLLTVHKDSPRVKDIMKLEKRSRQRMNALHLLANEGNLKHNAGVLKAGVGKIVVSHRTSRGRKVHKPNEFGPCTECHKFVLRKTLWLHHRKCIGCPITQATGEPAVQCKKPFGHISALSRTMLANLVASDDEQNLSKVLSRMRDDSLKQIVQQDDVIRRFLSLRADSLGPLQSKKDNEVPAKESDVHRISQQARNLARLVLECRQEIPHATLCNLIRPECIDLVVKSAQKLSYDAASGKSPITLGRAMGNALSHAIETKISQCNRSGDTVEADKARQFREIFRNEWNSRVNRRGVIIMNHRRRTKLSTIPITDDLVKLRNFILSEIQRTSETMLEGPIQSSDWTWLAKLVMSRLIVFNKRRRAEVKDMKVVDYINRPPWHSRENGELRMAMSQSDAAFAARCEPNVFVEIC